MNIMAQVEFKRTYYDSAVQHIAHYITRTHPHTWGSQRVYYTLECASLQHVYHMTKAVQAVQGTPCD